MAATMTKPGPKPLPPEQKLRRVAITLSHEAREAIEEMNPRSWSELISQLLVAEVERRRKKADRSP